MRLNSLDITRYGKFTDHVIDFGRPVDGQPDLHIIYGPNEAGKSTAFAAFLDLLFGIEARSRFNFIHPYSAMRIGAVLDTSDGVFELARIKRPQRSLLDGNDRPIAESLIQNELGGLDREAYRMMFSLDDDTLEAGGESILASKGDLGQLLFAASTGLADLSRALIDLKAEADGFYKYRARSGELQELKTELAALKTEREKIDTFAAEYAQLVKVRDRAKAQYDDAITERGRTQARIEDIQRYLTAMPRLAAFRAVRDKLGQFSGLPEAPDGWLNDLPTLQTEEIELGTRLKEAEAEIERITAELEAIDTDKTALRHADRIDALSELRARHVAAENDLPERRLQLQELELKISGILNRLGKPDVAEPASLVLDASTVGLLRELIETRSGVEASVNAAQRELEEARERLEEAQGRQQTDCENGGAEEEIAPRIAVLMEIVGRLRGSEHLSRQRLAERACRSCSETLAQRMAELRPWAGNHDQLAELNVPLSGDIERWKETLAEANRLIDRHEAEIDRLESERRRVQARLDTISSVDGVVSEGDAAKVRAEREKAWANHRREMDETSATAFEAVLRHDDIVVNARLRHEAEIAKLHEASATLAALNADLETSGERLKTALASRQTVHDELAAFLLSMTPGLPNSFALSQLETWLARREVALEARAGLKRAEQDLEEARADVSAARESLSNALNALPLTHDPETSLESLLVLAQSAVDREARLRSLREDLRNRDGDVKARERAFRKASEADEAWRASWDRACSESWLGDGGAAPSVAAVREILAALAELGPTVESRSSLADRICKMEDDEVRFRAEVTAIAQLLQLDAQSSDAMSLAHQMAERLQQARAAQSAKAAVAQALKKARARQRDLAASLDMHNRRTEEMTAFFQVSSLAEVAVKLQDIARRTELNKQLGEAERDILETLGLPSIEAAETALDATDRATLESELAGFKGRFSDQDERTRELFSNYRKAVDQIEAVGGDGAAANIEEKRQTVLLQIEEKARRYMRLRVGILAAGHALHLYRDKHRSSMMARASSAFRAISREAYSKLTTQLEKDDEILIAVSADGSSKVASELSKGTRFQLYLALRVAGYYEFAQSRPLVPFIADDIMETFDEFRAEETFRVFAEMAQVGQVIYLTHHRHLCEIAQSICPEVRVHDLTAPSIRKQSLVSVA